MLRDIYWWFAHRVIPSKQFHIVRTSLEPGYYDPDIRIKQVMFELVKEFIETAPINWEATKEHYKAYQTLSEAVSWYFEEKPVWESMLWVNGGRDSDLDCELEIGEIDKIYMKKIVDNIDYCWYP